MTSLQELRELLLTEFALPSNGTRVRENDTTIKQENESTETSQAQPGPVYPQWKGQPNGIHHESNETRRKKYCRRLEIRREVGKHGDA